GLSLNSEGKVTQVIWDGPAFEKGIAVGDQIVAVSGRSYSGDGIKSAITAAKGTRNPIRLLVKSGERYRDVGIDYAGGLRYPRLEKVGTGEGSLDKLLQSR